MNARLDSLELLGIAPSTARILRYFLLRPEARPHIRQLQRILGLGGASVQRDLDRLVKLGALERFEEGRLVRYAVASKPELWTALRLMIGSVPDPLNLVHDALCDVSGLEAAFIFGSAASGTMREDSDIDVFVVEDPEVDRRALLRQLAEVGMVLGREINTVRYTQQTLAERLGNPAHPASNFIREVLSGPKHWVAGTPNAIMPLTTSVGLSLNVEATPA